MNGYENDEAYRMLSTVGQILEDALPLAINDDDSSDDELDIDVNADITNEDQRRRAQLLDDDYQRTAITDVIEEEVVDEEIAEELVVNETESRKLGYNKYMIENVWRAGEKLLIKDGVGKKRQKAFVRIERRRRINETVSTSLSEQSNSDYQEKKEVNINMPVWTRHIMHMFPNFYEC